MLTYVMFCFKSYKNRKLKELFVPNKKVVILSINPNGKWDGL